MENNIIIKGTPQKNKTALIITIVGAVIFLLSFIIAIYVFNNEKDSYYFLGEYLGRYYYCVIYDFDFVEFFLSEFFECIHGYLFLIGLIATIVGIVIKNKTEKCEITVRSDAIIGVIPKEKRVHIPLNQVTGINRCSFNGVSIKSIGNMNNFYCFENREAIMQALAHLLASPQNSNSQPVRATNITVGKEDTAAQLMKLKELLDSGILTQEEFEAKKKQLLGL